MVRQPLIVVVACLFVFAVGLVYGPGALAQGMSCADAGISAQGPCSDEDRIAGASGDREKRTGKEEDDED